MKIRILLADDHPMIRAGFKSMLDKNERFEIVGEAADFESAIPVLETTVPDAAIIGDDLPYAEKSALLTVMRSNFPEVRVIELSDLEKAFLRKVNLDPSALDHVVFSTIFASSSPGSTQ